ncbi:MAG: CAP domain-containing protein, partial [Enterococcus gilvus]
VDYGKPYTATARTFTGYTVSGSNKQTVTVNGNTTITFTYTVNKYNVTIIHKGNDGKNLAANQVVSVDYGKPYTATARTFTGYTLSGSNTQTVTVNGHKTITFNYTKNVVKHKVTIVHKGNDGKTLHTETVDAEQGKAYVANSKSFAGYQLKGSSAQTVTITQPTTITFNYNSLAFDRVMIHAKVDGKIIKSVTFDIKPGEKFKATTDKLKLDPDVYDVGTNWAYSEITGVGGKEINYTFTIEYFRHYLSASELTIMQQTIVQKVNELRTSLGRTPLTENLKLSAAANVRSDELRQKFAHVRPDGSSIYTAIDEQGLSVGGSRGENIAMNSNHTSGQSAGLAMFEQWKNSPGHYANMIDTDFNYIGIGVYCHGSKVYGTQLFVGNIY